MLIINCTQKLCCLYTCGQRNVNPKGPDGKTLLSNACGSFRHLVAACPDSWENRSEAHVLDAVEGEEAVLFTGYSKKSVMQRGVEAKIVQYWIVLAVVLCVESTGWRHI